MLYLVGLGLADETDITVKGLEIVRKAERVYLEAYTSILLVDKAKLVSHSLRTKVSNSSDCMRSCSRKLSMAGLSLWRTAKWSSLPVTRF